ncbi:glycosyltransferase [uncultured Halomonas sp.]|uniref:glycosyltransferase n=1 Tax=uncultured Halomonas sp. TaxID=173971 RepID=UPI00261DBFDE|nr:glycosyltransferase [uncultured Halomonas sp.]
MIDSLKHRARELLKELWILVPSFRALRYRKREGVYLFLPINGVGLGHLTRCLAIARRVRQRDPGAIIVFVTTSIALPIVHRAGFICHHIPPAALAGRSVSQADWNRLFSRSLEEVIELYRPACLVFDGSFPYVGLRRVLRRYRRRIERVWVKRGLNKAAAKGEKGGIYASRFDKVIFPQEVSARVDVAADDDAALFAVNPIYLLGREELLERAHARRMLSLDAERPFAYVQLGAGNINEVEDLQGQVIRALKRRGFLVVVARSPISLQSSGPTGADRVIMDYPNSRYYEAFDLAVMAGGYNSVCEAVAYGVPTIFIPNVSTGSDDQLKRVNQVRREGYYEVMTTYDDKRFTSLVDRVMTAERSPGGYGLACENGAEQAAALVARFSRGEEHMIEARRVK